MTAPTLFDFVGASHHDDPVTSVEAAADVPRLAGQRRQVLLELVAAGDAGLTGHEACERTSCLFPHVAGTRLGELRRLGLAEVTDRTRPTPSGHRAGVYVATTEGFRMAGAVDQ